MRILIADDHGIVRGGMKLLIDRQPDMEVVAEAGDGVEAFEKALATKPDLCVMDVSMPRMTGLQAARQIRAHLPETQVLALLDARRRALRLRRAEGRRVAATCSSARSTRRC